MSLEEWSTLELVEFYSRGGPMSLVDHVARAIREAGDSLVARKPTQSTRAGVEALARAAIRAMREPTVDMVEAARVWSAAKYGKPIDPEGAAECWRAMIDRALAEGEQ